MYARMQTNLRPNALALNLTTLIRLVLLFLTALFAAYSAICAVMVDKLPLIGA